MDISVNTLWQMIAHAGYSNDAISIDRQVFDDEGRQTELHFVFKNSKTRKTFRLPAANSTMVTEAQALDICNQLQVPVRGPLAEPFIPYSAEEMEAHVRQQKCTVERDGGVLKMRGKRNLFTSRRAEIDLAAYETDEQSQTKLQCDFARKCVYLGIPVPAKLTTKDRSTFTAVGDILDAADRPFSVSIDSEKRVRFADTALNDQSLEEETLYDTAIFVEDDYIDYSQYEDTGDLRYISIESSEAHRTLERVGGGPSARTAPSIRPVMTMSERPIGRSVGLAESMENIPNLIIQNDNNAVSPNNDQQGRLTAADIERAFADDDSLTLDSEVIAFLTDGLSAMRPGGTTETQDAFRSREEQKEQENDPSRDKDKDEDNNNDKI